MRFKRERSSLKHLLDPEFWLALSQRGQRGVNAYLKKDFWELISEDYDELDEGNFYGSLQEDILQEMERRGALRSDFTFFDVCCGTGAYTVRVAPKVSKVYALDFSPSMLRILRKKAEEAGIRNITIIEADWREFRPQEKYDTVFVSMTPILRDLKEVERILAMTKRYFIAVQWAGLRRNYLLEEIEKKFFKTYREEKYPGIFLLFNYLYAKGTPGDIKFYHGVLERRTALEKFYQRLKFRLSAKGYKIGPRKEKAILDFLKERAKEGILRVRTEVRIGALFLKKEDENLGTK